MFKRYVFVLIVILASISLVHQPVTAKEDIAQIKLKKTAISKKDLYIYTVKEGDNISTIIKNIPGMTEVDISKNYQLIKELNPDVPNLENLAVGQSIILPGKPLIKTEEKINANEVERTTLPSEKVSSPDTSAKEENVKKPALPNTKFSSSDKIYYKIKRGDNLYKIIYRELKLTGEDVPKMLQTIKSMNSGIKNIDKIYAGTVIQLPGKNTPQEMASTSTESVQHEKIIEIKEKKIMPQEARLALLKQVITQMNGTITTAGNYYLPIPQAGQVTIDCSKIPVIEFNDNTTVFLDLENRAHNNLKKMISNNWKNYNLVKVDNDDDIFNILKKILTTTKTFDIIKTDKPLTVGTRPTLEILVDWLIVKPIPGQHSKSVVQGLRPIYENTILLPKSIKNYAQKSGLLITEFSDETGIVGKPEELYSLPPIPVFSTTSAKDFSYSLVSHLGLGAEKDIDIKLFDTLKDGFNLSIKADVLVSKEDKKYLIYSQPLSQQFTSALKQAVHETIFVSDSDSPKNIMANVLSSLNISFTYDNFIFSGQEKNQAPFVLKFSGTKINQDLYVVNFDIDSELRGLLQEVWSVKIARY